MTDRQVVEEGMMVASFAVQLIRDRPTPRLDSGDRAKLFINWHGLKIGVTHRAGIDKRHGRDMKAHYGFVRGTYGQADDGMAIDVYLIPDSPSKGVYEVQQLTEEGEDDEKKYILGATSEAEARETYLAHMPVRFFGSVKRAVIGAIAPRQDSEFSESGIVRDERGRFARKQSSAPAPQPIAPKSTARPHTTTVRGNVASYNGYGAADETVYREIRATTGAGNRRRAARSEGARKTISGAIMRWGYDLGDINDAYRIARAGKKVPQLHGDRHNAIKDNSVGIIKVMSQKSLQGDRTALRSVTDKNGTVQAVAKVLPQKDGSMHVQTFAVAPWNLSNKITQPFIDNAEALGLTPEQVELLEEDRMPDASIAFLESIILEAQEHRDATIRQEAEASDESEDVVRSRWGDRLVSADPLDENRPLFKRGGFKDDPDTQGRIVLSTADAEKFLEMRDRHRTDSMTDEEARAWEDELIALCEDLGGFMCAPKDFSGNKNQNRKVIARKIDLSDSLHLDAEPEDPDLADFLRDRLMSDAAPIFTTWINRMGRWLREFGTLEQARDAIDNQPQGIVSKLELTDLAVLLGEGLLTADLMGREEVLREGQVMRQGGNLFAPQKRPGWLSQGFSEAIQYFRGKVNISAEERKNLPEGYHDWAFTVAGMTKADMIDASLWLIDRAISEGMSFEDFEQQWNRLIRRRGWTPRGTGSESRRIYTIFDTNVRGAYGAGRDKQMNDSAVRSRRPLWLWRHRDSPNFRPLHKALHNVAIPADHEFWDSGRIPAGFGCRCGKFSISEDYARRNGIRIETNPPDPETIFDPGFRNPFNTSNIKQQRQQIFEEKMSGLNENLSAAIAADIESTNQKTTSL
jgi:hypothetical protein